MKRFRREDRKVQKKTQDFLHRILFSLSILSASSLFALEIDPGQYVKSEKEKTSVPRVVNPSFEEGETGWKLEGKYTVGRGFGTLASGGLLTERSDPEEYCLCAQNLKLEPGKIYNFSIMIRSEDVTCGDPREGTFAVEFSDGTGGRRVAVVSLGPDPAEAEITVDFPDQLQSQYGKTERKDGKWFFRAEQIDSDLLVR